MKPKLSKILSFTVLFALFAIISLSLFPGPTSGASSLKGFLLDHIAFSKNNVKVEVYAPYAESLASTLSAYSPEQLARIFPGMELPVATN